MRRCAVGLGALGLGVATACGDGVRVDSGADARLFVEQGTFRRGSFPKESGGPPVLAAYLGRTTLRVGEQNKSFSGVLGEGASAVAIALEADRGYWTVPAGFPFPETPEAPSFSAPLSFSAELPLGPARLWLWAVNDRGEAGPPHRVAFELVRAPRPEGALIVQLSWDVEADLDLHVVTPNGVEIHQGNPSSAVAGTRGPSSGVLTPGEGRIDLDSNAGCVPDGRNAEHVTWASEPPRGQYRVHVDAFSLCGHGIARWEVTVWSDGRRIAAALGTSTRAATRGDHGRGAGVLALEFEAP